MRIVDWWRWRKVASVFSHCSSLYSPSMVDSSIELTGGAKQHCHSCCNICRNKQRQDFLSKVKKSYKKRTQFEQRKDFLSKVDKVGRKRTQSENVETSGRNQTKWTWQHCHSCNICRKEEEYIFYQKWTKSNKSVHNRENVDKSGHNYTTLSKLLHLQKESRKVIDHAFKRKQKWDRYFSNQSNSNSFLAQCKQISTKKSIVVNIIRARIRALSYTSNLSSYSVFQNSLWTPTTFWWKFSMIFIINWYW